MKKSAILSILIIVLAVSFFLQLDSVFAKSEREIRIRDSNGVEKRFEIKEDDDGTTKTRIRIKTHSEDDDEGNGVEIKDGLKIKQETKNGQTRLRIEMRNGETKDLSILPDEALATSISELGSDEIEIEIKEEDDGIVYRAKKRAKAKLLGFIPVEMDITADIDTETGEVIGKKKAWWAFLATGEDEVQTSSGSGQVTICHYPPGNPSDAQTITVGAPAVSAHVRNHGDTLGACAGGNQTTTPPINNTNSTLPGLNNTNITLPGTNNTNVTLPGNNNTNTTPVTN